MNFQLWLRQTQALTLANLKIRYRKTWAGFLWVLLNPLLMLAAQTFVFSKILNIHVEKYFFYLVSGYLPWFFLSQTLDVGVPLLKSFGNTVKSFSVHPTQIVASLVFENSLTFFSASALAFLVSFVLSGWSLNNILLWFFCAIPLVLTVFFLTFTAAIINIIFRDLRFLLGFSLSLIYFFTPIFYFIDTVPSSFRSIILLNPFYWMLQPFQNIFLNSSPKYFMTSFLISLLITIVTGALAFFTWKKLKNGFYHHI